MINYTLHKLPEGFIVTSDEEPFNTDLCLYSNQEILPFDGNLGEIWNYELCKKVITQQDQIDLSALSEEEQKRIGWFDVEKLAELEIPYQPYDSTLYQGYRKYELKGFINGFQKAYELLSDRTFTLEQVKEALFQVLNNGDEEYCVTKTRDSKVRSILKSLSQPKSWKIELELEPNCEFQYKSCSFYKKNCGCNLKPKFTNNKIKIIKIYN